MNRREFLRSRRLIDIAAPMIGVAAELEPANAQSTEPTMLRFARKAMATTFEVIMPFDASEAHVSAQAGLDEIDRIESQLTVYRSNSEVSRLNAMALYRPVYVERNLFDLLRLAAKIHGETEGAFDVSVGALIKSWGFFRRAGRVPSLQERNEVRERMGMQYVLLDAQRQTVHYQRPGIEINLGSIGKGFALDCAARLANARNVLIHGGHSSILALGVETPGSSGWTIGLTDPLNPMCRRALVQVRNRGMATSAITHQNFENEGKKLGHLLDPRTAWPAEGTLSATATAPTAAEADALATAFFILGSEKTRVYCDSHPEIGAALIEANAPHRLVVLGRGAEEIEIIR